MKKISERIGIVFFSELLKYVTVSLTLYVYQSKSLSPNRDSRTSITLFILKKFRGIFRKKKKFPSEEMRT